MAQLSRITVVGSGNAFNSDGRAHACYLAEDSAGRALIVDAGATTLFRLQQMSFDFERLSGLLFTHYHGDHMAGAPFLLLHLALIVRRQAPLLLGGPVGIAERVRAWSDLAYPGIEFEERFPLPTTELTAGQMAALGEFSVSAYPITHREESLGYRIAGRDGGRTFAFSGDTAFDERLLALLDGVDVGIMELSMERQTDPPTAHVTLQEVSAELDRRRQAGLPARLGATRLIYSHIYNDLAVKAAALGEGEVAFDGMQIEL